MDDASNHERIIDELDKDDAVTLMDDKEEDTKEEEAKVDENDQVQGRQAEFQAEIYKINLDHASKVLSMHEDEPAEVQEVVDVVTTAKLIKKVVTAASETVTTAKEGKEWLLGILKKNQLHPQSYRLKPNPRIKGKGLCCSKYQAMKRKPQTEAQARKNMMMYLKNVAGFRLDYFKGMSYDYIRLIFEAKFNSNVDFLLKTKEQMAEEESRALQRINETPAERAAKRRKLDEEVEDLKRHMEIVANEDDDVYTKATLLPDIAEEF
nr:hypothetical protein [Tanacetum cinerariifolium]